MDDIEPDGMVVHNFLFSTQAMLGGAWKALGKAMEAGNFERAPKKCTRSGDWFVDLRFERKNTSNKFVWGVNQPEFGLWESEGPQNIMEMEKLFIQI